MPQRNMLLLGKCPTVASLLSHELVAFESSDTALGDGHSACTKWEGRAGMTAAS